MYTTNLEVRPVKHSEAYSCNACDRTTKPLGRDTVPLPKGELFIVRIGISKLSICRACLSEVSGFIARELTRSYWSYPRGAAELAAWAQVVADRTTDAYSYNSYANWYACALLLIKHGYTDREAEAILRSKHMRWARDRFQRSDKKPAPTSVLERYLKAEQINVAALLKS